MSQHRAERFSDVADTLEADLYTYSTARSRSSEYSRPMTRRTPRAHGRRHGSPSKPKSLMVYADFPALLEALHTAPATRHPHHLLEVVRAPSARDAMALDAARKRLTTAGTEVETLTHRVAAASSEAKRLEARAEAADVERADFKRALEAESVAPRRRARRGQCSRRRRACRLQASL